jgi:RimJ/RimL family protein N-acetyltransferase
MKLSGTHVELQPLSLEHLDGLVAAANEDRANYQWTWVPQDRDTMKRYIEVALAELDRGASIPYATVRRDGRISGSTRFMNIERWPNPFLPPPPKTAPIDALEIGTTWLAASAQRTVVNTEAKLLMLGFAFEQLKVKRVTLKTDERNVKSRRAIERLGAKLDGVLRAWQRAVDGAPRNTATYSILASEWGGVKERLRARLSEA